MKKHIGSIIIAVSMVPGLKLYSQVVVPGGGMTAAPQAVPVISVPVSVSPNSLGQMNGNLGASLSFSLPGELDSLNSKAALKTSAVRTLSVSPSLTRPAAGISTRLTLPAPPGQLPVRNKGVATVLNSQKKNPALKGLVEAVNKLRTHSASNNSGLGVSLSRLNNLFDGMGTFSVSLGVNSASDMRKPDWAEDRRINRALKLLGDRRKTPIGADIYGYVYKHYGDKLKIMIDDDRNASYDARLVWEKPRQGKKRPVMYLTEKLVDKQSSQFVAAFIGRELSELYYHSFPVSAERNYLVHSNMVRIYAEITDSGMERYNYWWDKGHDQRSGRTYVMKRYYGSWGDGHKKTRWGGDVRRQAFFKWLRDHDDSNINPQSRLTLRQLYNRGTIGGKKYRQMNRYFGQVVDSEKKWFDDTDRW